MSCMSQNFRLFHVSNLSVRNYRIFLLMYTGSVLRQQATQYTRRLFLQSAADTSADRCPVSIVGVTLRIGQRAHRLDRQSRLTLDRLSQLALGRQR